jgi:putative two-component system hydrogenase maturation factor HypX/HoxX
MRILLIASAYNSMTQRVHVELADRGHDVSVELALGDEVVRDAVRRCDPDLVIAPMLTTAIPADVWSAWPCFIVHPGPVGDRGPSSLDWAIMDGAGRWGVTVLQANGQMDAGDIWASAEFPVPPGCSKGSLYRTEVADAALEAVLAAVARFAGGSYRPEPLDYGRPDVTGRCRPPCRQADRRIDWAEEPTCSVAAKLRAADSRPGVLDVIGDAEYFMFGGHEEDQLRGEPGSLIAQRDGAICRATVDGAVWIPQLRRRPAPTGSATCKLPATMALGESAAEVPHVPAPLTPSPGRRTYQQISYREAGGVGHLEFAFPAGAMSTGQCRRLLAAYRHAQARPVKVIVLGGARDFFSNGIHLNVIEAAADPAEESWRNINAIDDLVEAILTTTGQLTVAAIAGNAAAGGLMLALAADQVWCRAGAVLNPHYRLMGLHGSEYWTYTLPRRVGTQHAARLTQACLPVAPASALRVGLVDRVITGGAADYHAQVATLAARLACSPDYPDRLAAKTEELAAAQKLWPLAAYRAAELAIMSRNFSGPSEPYPELRRAFVYKHKPTRTPPHLTRQPALPRRSDQRPLGAGEAPVILDHQPAPMEGQATFLDCPACLGLGGAERCGLPAEVEERYSIGSTDGTLESARIRCPQGHWFNGPIESLTIPQRSARAGAPASPSSDVIIQNRGAQVTGPMREADAATRYGHAPATRAQLGIDA